MRMYTLPLVVCLCGSLASCSRSGPPASGGAGGTVPAPTADTPGRPEGFHDGFGHLGETTSGGPDGSYAIKCPYSQLGNEYVLSGYVERPGKPLAAAYLLLLRQESATSSSVQVHVGGGMTDIAHAHQSFPAAGGDRFWVRYTLAKDSAAEQFSLGEKGYALDGGRVFLIDLRIKPAKVLQVKEDLAGLLPAKEPSKEDLRSVRGKLEGRHESVRGFWQE